MSVYHTTVATTGRGPLFDSPSALLRGTRAVARTGGPGLLLFSLVDDHVHLVVSGDASRVATTVGHALTACGAAEREPSRIRPVDGRSHLISLVGYLCRQVTKHGLGAHPALWPGSCAQDLLGVRRLAGFDAGRIAFALPRADVEGAVLHACGLPRNALVPVAVDTVEAWRAAHEAVALDPAGERGRDRTAARIAWASLVSPPFTVACAAVGLPERTFRRLRASEPDADVRAIVLRRVALEAWVAAIKPQPFRADTGHSQRFELSNPPEWPVEEQ